MRGRLALLASALLLVGTLLAVPSVSNAAAIKQFTAEFTPGTATGGVAGTWTLEIKNCGTPVEAPCMAASTIAIGQVRITVPPEFRSEPVFSVSAPPNNWRIVSYNSANGVLVVEAVTGNDKLASGETVDITVEATPECISGPKVFTTTAVGGLPNGPNNQTFVLVSPSQPSVTIAGCQLASGGSATDPETGQTETIEGDFTGHVNISFGGTTADCSFDTRATAAPGDGATTYGAQWARYHLATQVTITPADDFNSPEGSGPKVSTSEFDQSIFGGDSSWYLVCYAVPIDDDHDTAFETIGGGTAEDRTVDGVHYWVGILASCDEANAPCVSEQFLTTGPGTPPPLPGGWSPAANRIHIAIEIPPNDPYKR
jgi:hypothetical protein